MEKNHYSASNSCILFFCPHSCSLLGCITRLVSCVYCYTQWEQSFPLGEFHRKNVQMGSWRNVTFLKTVIRRKKIFLFIWTTTMGLVLQVCSLSTNWTLSPTLTCLSFTQSTKPNISLFCTFNQKFST